MSYSYQFDDKDWNYLVDLAIEIDNTYGSTKKNTGFTNQGNKNYSVHKQIIGLQGEFLFQYIFKGINNFQEINMQVYEHRGDGGVDNYLKDKSIEMKTSENTVLPADIEVCLCGEVVERPKHHLLAFPQKYADGKYKLTTKKDVLFLFKAEALDWRNKNMDISHTNWDNPNYKVTFCGFRSNRWCTENEQIVQLKSGPNLAWCENQLHKDVNDLINWINKEK